MSKYVTNLIGKEVDSPHCSGKKATITGYNDIMGLMKKTYTQLRCECGHTDSYSGISVYINLYFLN